MNIDTTSTRRQVSTGSPRGGRSRGGARRGTAMLFAGAAVAALALVPSAAHASFTPGFDDRRPVEIVNAHTGLRADVMWASTADNQGAFLWPNNRSASQEFDLVPTDSGYYRVKARHSGKCLTLQRGAGFRNGTPVVQLPCNAAGVTSSQWKLRTVGDSSSCSYDPASGEETCTTTSAIGNTLINRYTGRCLDSRAPNGRPGAEAVLQQWDCISNLGAWNVANQRFDFKNIR